LDSSSRKRAERIPRVLVAKFANTKEGRNSLLVEAAFSRWFRFPLSHRMKHSSAE
jgi:hypothetical protein